MQRLREARGMTQTDLAKALKAEGLPFHQQTVQRIENGERPIRLNEAHLIARLFEADMETMTGSLVSSDHEILWSMTRVSSEATEIALAIVENYHEWMEKVAELAGHLIEFLEREHKATFDELPAAIRSGLAFCKHILDTSATVKDAYTVLLTAFGDSEGETREDRWSVAEPDETVLHDIQFWIRRYDGDRLRELTERSPLNLMLDIRIPERSK